MLVDLRPHARLRGTTPVDLSTAVTPVLEALGEDDADLDRVRVVCDWVQYKQSFRDVVDVRPILSCDGTGAGPFTIDGFRNPQGVTGLLGFRGAR